MATIDELFATMTEETTTSAIDELLIIDPNTRQISLPGAELVFGVEGDAGSERKYFLCPRIVGNNLDLASSFVRVVYRNANGEEDAYPVTDVTLNDSGDAVMFSWELMGKVTRYKGQVKFLVYAVGPDLKTKWHTTLATGISLEGLTPDTSSVETETADVVAQLIAMVEAQTVAVQNEGVAQINNVKKATVEAQNLAIGQIEAKGTEVLGSIPDDYTTVSQKVNGQANAIIGKVSGEVVRVDDVSPIEHTMGVRVHNTNLCEIIGEHVATVRVGGYYSPKRLTYAAPYMENGKTYVFTAESDDDLKDTVLSVVVYGLRASGSTSLDSRSNPGTLRCVVTPSDFKRIDSVELRFNRLPSTSATEERTITYRNIYFGLIENEGKGYSYIDPTTVTLTRCGKNLIPYPYASSKQDYNGIVFTPNEDGSVTINGTSTNDGISFMLINTGAGSRRYLPAGTYYLSCPELKNNADVFLSLFYYDDNETSAFSGTSGKNSTLILDEGRYYGLYFRVYGGVTINNLTVHPQLELGSSATEYEPYNGTTISPTSDGTVAGLTSLSPTMTLLTDKAGVTVECEYNRDTNKVIAELLNKIAELSA